MPRSGTSLIEQVLSSSKEIYAAGELSFFPYLMNSLLEEKYNQKKITSLFNNLAIKYSSNLSKLTDKFYVIDKMPTNYYFIGFIKLLFPNSKIINTFRDPIATCFSNYKIFFSSEMMQYSCDLNYIVDVYKIYQKTINFWNKKNIDNLFHIKYEDLTENPNKYFKKIFKFLEIDFNESFLDIDKSSRAVTTASSNQLSNKIYKGSSDYWLHYKKHLFPLIKEFT